MPRLRRVAEEATGATAGIATKHLSLVSEAAMALGVLADLARQDRREAAFAVLILADEFGDAGATKLRSLVREALIADDVARAIAEAIAQSRGWNLAVPRPPYRSSRGVRQVVPFTYERDGEWITFRGGALHSAICR